MTAPQERIEDANGRSINAVKAQVVDDLLEDRCVVVNHPAHVIDERNRFRRRCRHRRSELGDDQAIDNRNEPRSLQMKHLRRHGDSSPLLEKFRQSRLERWCGIGLPPIATDLGELPVVGNRREPRQFAILQSRPSPLWGSRPHRGVDGVDVLLIVALRAKREAGDIGPFVNRLRTLQRAGYETIYLVGSAERDNRAFMDQIARTFREESSWREVDRRIYKATLRHRDGSERAIEAMLIGVRTSQAAEIIEELEPVAPVTELHEVAGN